MARRTLLFLIAAFLVTRVALVALTSAPLNVTSSGGDFDRYRLWSGAVVGDGVMPYSEITIEYPPGSLPFVLAPEVFGADNYRGWFVALMVAVDVVGFVGAMLLARRTGLWLGPVVWIVGLFLLGPIVYLRLDLVPAVATLLAIERLAAGAAFSSGALFGFGIAAKLYPALLLPAALWKVVRSRRFVLGAGVALAVALLPFVRVLGDMWESVLGYHFDRGIQLESSWGGWLLVAARRGYDVARVYAFGAQQLVSDVSGLLKAMSGVLSLAALAGGTFIVGRRVRRGDVGALAAGLYGVLAIVMFFGSVLSPQFVMWLLALATAALCFEQGPRRVSLLLVLVIAVATQFVFPFNYYSLVNGRLGPLLILIGRNLLLLGSGLTVLAALSPNERARDTAPRLDSELRPS